MIFRMFIWCSCHDKPQELGIVRNYKINSLIHAIYSSIHLTINSLSILLHGNKAVTPPCIRLIFRPEERLELEQKEQLLMEEAQGIYPEWNEMTDISLIEAMFSLQEEERKLIYQHVFEERTFKEMSILNQMTEERCKGAYYWAIRKIRKRMGGKKS